MRLLVVERDTWTVTAAQERTNQGNYHCPLTESINALGANYDKSVDGLLSLLEKFSKHGTRILNDELCHEVDSENKIFEFIKGSLRLLWFYGAGNKIIICSHVFIKKGQKTPAAQKNAAIELKNKYAALIESGKKVDLYFEE